MNPLSRIPGLLILLSLWLLIPQSAQGYYNPSTGRWLTRDPINEAGFGTTGGATHRIEGRDQALYDFVANNPINRIDYLGLRTEPPIGPPDHCQDPCGDAKKRGLDKNIKGLLDWGGVICCSGMKYACIWSTGNATNQKAKDIITKCTTAHETDHFDDVDCPKCWKRGFPTRPQFKKGKDWESEECTAYTVQLNCLQASIGDCGGDTDCADQVTDAMQYALDGINDHCFE